MSPDVYEQLKNTESANQYNSTPGILLRNKKSIWTILIIGTFFLAFFFGVTGMIFGIIGMIIFLTKIKLEENLRIIKKFAFRNGFHFQDSLDIKDFKGRLFLKKPSNVVRNVITGTHNNFPLKLFNYFYTEGSGKHRRTYYFTTCVIEIEKINFPYILLQSKLMQKYQYQDYFGEDKDVEIPLPSETKDAFKLYCTKNYEIEVLQIFTQDILKQLNTYGATISIEFAGNRIYFYDDKRDFSETTLDNLYRVVKIFLDNTGELLNRLHDDFQAIHEIYNKPS